MTELLISSSRLTLTDRAELLICFQVVHNGRTISEVVRELGNYWNTIKDAVPAYGNTSR